MNKTTIQEAQALKKVLVETIEEALNTFTTKTGLQVDCLDVKKVHLEDYGNDGPWVIDPLTRSYVEPKIKHYEVTVTVTL